MKQSIQLHARRIIKNGALYVGGDMGLYKVSGGSIDLIHDQKPILSLAQYGDTILTSARNAQVHRFVNDQWEKKIPLSEDSLKRLAVLGLERDQNNRLWVGSWEGLFVFDKNDKLLKRFSLNNKENNREQNITNLFIDSRDRLWIITSAYGIYMLENVSLHSLDHIDENIIHYTYEEGNRNSITSNLILTIEEDDFGAIWFGTDVGVVSYNEKDNSFQRLYYQGRLFDKKIMTIRKDGSKNLWITTINNGIYVLNQVDGSMRHFIKNDGLISNAFLYGSGYYDNVKQHMYFGTDEGIQQIDLTLPFYNYDNNIPILTGIEVNGEKSNLFSAWQSPFLNEISLSATQNDFSVSFSDLDFMHADKIDYYYSLDNEAWKVTDLQKAYFTNVPYGNHTLKVKAVYDGIVDDSEGRQINIYIAPPWYYSHFAKAVYVILSVVLLLVLYRYLKSRWQMRAELHLNRLEAERLKKLNDSKSRLYTDIAHEFKTPLTLISGPIQMKLKDKDLSDDDRKNFATIERNANRLISLVDQLLQLAKLEDGNLKLNVGKGDLGNFLQMIAHSFDYHANLKEMRYTADIAPLGEVWYDPDILEKIISNLLSNAFKYSPEGGFCEFKVNKSSDYVNIDVKNTALDVSELDLEKMFTRFYQRDEYSEGVGVGLALVKELTHFYGGSITGNTENESIITFSVRLPYHFDAFKPEDIGQNDQSFEVEKEESYQSPVNADENHHSGLPILLIAEDSAEIREFVRQSMREKYQILGAENGEIALKTALKYVPDIVLSDIRMPVMDGVELCNTLKTDERTSHIPVILLTAGASEEYELKGLSSGADVFLTKPFKVAILEQHITNFIDLRRVLHERYRNEFLLKPHKIALTSTDEVFLNKVKEVMDSELSNSDFNATTFSKMVNMSRMQLHRKLLAYTGLSTTAFIRSQRLQQAIHILETSDATINEVAYAVGFNTPSYFMKCFKETFKKTPSEYLSTKQPS
ncbi:MAG: response regulator [Bacteroidota bacterium]